MPEIIILAGPNGAGKTTLANQFLSEEEPMPFVNADELARSISARSQSELDIAAARLMLRNIEALAAARHDFMFETTLSSLGYARKVSAWQSVGYHVGLVYLRLPDVDASIARVARRVAEGGHGIPEEVIRRRFHRSLTCLSLYKALVNEWYVCDSVDGAYPIIDAWNR